MAGREATRRRGFSLIELLIVIAIAGIMATMTASYLLGARPHSQLEQAEVELTGTLNQARHMAVSEEVQARVVLDIDAGEYRIERLEIGSVNWTAVLTRRLPDLIEFDGAGTSFPANTVHFTARGSLLSGGNIVLVSSEGTTRTLAGNLATGRFNFGAGNLR